MGKSTIQLPEREPGRDQRDRQPVQRDRRPRVRDVGRYNRANFRHACSPGFVARCRRASGLFGVHRRTGGRTSANNGRVPRIPQLAEVRARALRRRRALVAAAAAGSRPPARAEDAIGTAASAPDAAAPAPLPARRPKIGVVLSGGGARGLTHIGVLKVLEEMRVPIDYITATSMGSIVGGLYASGVSAGEMERLVTSLDWPAFFSDQPPRRELSVRRKLEDALYTIPLELGFRDFSFKLATGALTGQNLELLLHGLTWRDDDIGSFDNLPIPFRAVATNLVDGREVVFDRGPLYIAMRGSMSMPGIFAPLDLDGRMLGDGGLVKNLPVDIVKAMGAEVVIAINIGTPLMTREQLSSFLGVAEQSINILTEQNVRAQRALLVPPRDVLIEPDLGDLSAADFNKGARFIALGEKAARAAADALSRYALSADDYAAYRLALRRPQRHADPELEFAGVRGTEITNPEVLQAQVGLEPGAKIDFPTAQTDIATLYGRGDFARIDYELIGQPPQRGVAVRRCRESRGDPTIWCSAWASRRTRRARTRSGCERATSGPGSIRWAGNGSTTSRSERRTTCAPSSISRSTSRRPCSPPRMRGIGTTTENIFSQGIKVAEYRVLDERVGVDLGLRVRQLGRPAGRARYRPRARRPGGGLAGVSRSRRSTNGESRSSAASIRRTTRSFRDTACA